MVEAATNAQIKEIFERNERTVRSDRRKKTVGKAELWVTELDALLERIRTAEADKARLSEALRKGRKVAVDVMKALMATGSRDNLLLADAVHKADDVARAALNGSGSGWRTEMENAPTNRALQIHIPNADYYGNDGVYAGMLVDMGTGKRWLTFGCHVGRDCGSDFQPVAWRHLPAAPQQGGE